MIASEHWTFGPVADRVGIVLIGFVMTLPIIIVSLVEWRKWRQRKRDWE